MATKQPTRVAFSSPALAGWALLLALLSNNPLDADPTHTELLSDLADPSHEKRQQATDALLTRDDVTLATIKSLFAQARSPEQLHRLARAAEHCFLRELQESFLDDRMAGALGITHKPISKGQLPEIDRAAVMVIFTLPGFPAHGRLRPGDLILSIGDEPIPANYTANQVSHRFIEIVRKHPAGQTIELLVLRNDRTITIQLRLANLAALEKMYSPNQNGLSHSYLKLSDAVIDELMMSAQKPSVIKTHHPASVPGG